MSAAIDPVVAAEAEEIAASASAELAGAGGHLLAVGRCRRRRAGAGGVRCACFPAGAVVHRPACSSADHAPDLVSTVTGTGTGRVMLLGHVDTVVSHDAHQPLRRDGDRLYGTGTVDMKGGDILALGVARALARRPETFAELAVLLVTDEEWRTRPFVHAPRFAGYDACLCFEGGELDNDGHEGVVVRRKAAGTLKVLATGRASHSGSAPDHGLNALLALAQTASAVAARHDPHGPQQLSVVPTVMRSGDAFNVVPAAGELIFDLRAQGLPAFDAVLAAVAPELDGVTLEASMERKWPGMDSTEVTARPPGPRLAAPGPADRRRPARRGQRRQPLRRHDRADRGRPRAAWRRGPHARGVRAASPPCASAPRWRWRSPTRCWPSRLAKTVAKSQ